MVIDVRPQLEPARLKALAEPRRLQIVELLADEELCVCHLSEELGIPQPLVSHHLKALREAELVESEKHHQWTYYRLRVDTVAALGEAITSLAASNHRRGARRRPCG